MLDTVLISDVAAGDFEVSVDDMGGGQIVLSQWNEAEGRTDCVAVTWGRLEAIVEALRPRYGDEGEGKNIDRSRALDL